MPTDAADLVLQTSGTGMLASGSGCRSSTQFLSMTTSGSRIGCRQLVHCTWRVCVPPAPAWGVNVEVYCFVHDLSDCWPIPMPTLTEVCPVHNTPCNAPALCLLWLRPALAMYQLQVATMARTACDGGVCAHKHSLCSMLLGCFRLLRCLVTRGRLEEVCCVCPVQCSGACEIRLLLPQQAVSVVPFAAWAIRLPSLTQELNLLVRCTCL